MWIQCASHNFLFVFFRCYCGTLAHGILCGRELWAFDIRFQNNFMSIVTHKMYIVHPYNILCEIFTVLCSAFLLFSVWCHCWKAIFSPLLLLYSKKLAKIIYALHRNFGVFSRVILNNSIKSKQTGLTVALSHNTVMLECDLEQERERKWEWN